MEQKIIKAASVEALNRAIETAQDKGWEPMGSHTALVVHAQNRFAGNQHKDTIYKTEYAQTIRKNGSRS